MLLTLKNKKFENLLSCIESEVKISINTPCSKKGICKGCSVKILEGCVNENGIFKYQNEFALSCQSTIQSDILKIQINDSCFSKISEIESNFTILRPIKNSNHAFNSVALDIGTTTLAAILFENKTGKIIKKASALNSQTKYADNVIERINCADNPKKLQQMHLAIIESVELLLNDLGYDFDRLFVSANTSMLHLFCNIDPSSMGVFPYTPNFLDLKKFSSKKIFNLKKEFEVTVLPSASAFIGADIIAGIISSDFKKAPCPALFVDIGTNGEIVLNDGKKIFSASAAAGPAFEGYGLSFGMRADTAAISKIEISNECEFKIETISNKPPIGICGSAYIDFLAQARQFGLLESSGRFSENAPVKIFRNFKALEIAKDIFITESDIANLLKSKAAICAAICVLLEESAVRLKDLKTLYIAGGFGKNLNFKNAKRCGLIPKNNASTSFLGNTALAGAYICALDDSAILNAQEISKEIVNVDLNSSDSFEDTYIDSLFLE